MTSLENRRLLAFALFAFDLVRGNIVIDNLSSRVVRRNLGYSLRHPRPLREDSHCSNFEFNDTVSRAIRIFNQFAKFYDDSLSKDTFKRNILMQMKTLHS